MLLFVILSCSLCILVLFGSLFLDELLEKSDKIFLEGCENTLGVFGRTFIFLNLLHANWDGASSSLWVMVVDEALAERLFQSQGLWELLNELLQVFLAVRIGRVITEHDALDVLLNWCPTFFIFEITADVPKFNMNLSKLRDTLWWISLKVDDSATNGGSIGASKSLLEITQNVCNGRLATLRWSEDKNFNSTHISFIILLIFII